MFLIYESAFKQNSLLLPVKTVRWRLVFCSRKLFRKQKLNYLNIKLLAEKFLEKPLDKSKKMSNFTYKYKKHHY